MEKILTTEEIIGLLPSKDLKAEIKKTGHRFTEAQLLQIINKYAVTFDERISLLERFSKQASPEISKVAKILISGHKEALQKFCDNSEGFIYELHIKETPRLADERYICASYESALECIDRFFERYADIDAKETEKTVYRIFKRRVFESGDGFEEDTYAECVLGAGKMLLSVDDYENEAPCDTDEECSSCPVVCSHWFEELMFPCFAFDKAIVKYSDYDGRERFGICLCGGEKCDMLAESLYIIPMDCDAIYYQRFEDVQNYHNHIDLPLAELADVDELKETDRNNYLNFIKWCSENSK